MQTRITARHFEASHGLRSHVARSLERLERYFDRVHDARVILSDGPGHAQGTASAKRAEIALRSPRQTFTAAGEGVTHEAAIDACVRQLVRQILRYKDVNHPRNSAVTTRD